MKGTEPAVILEGDDIESVSEMRDTDMSNKTPSKPTQTTLLSVLMETKRIKLEKLEAVKLVGEFKIGKVLEKRLNDIYNKCFISL